MPLCCKTNRILPNLKKIDNFQKIKTDRIIDNEMQQTIRLWTKIKKLEPSNVSIKHVILYNRKMWRQIKLND